jgi:hypothetical protein
VRVEGLSFGFLMKPLGSVSAKFFCSGLLYAKGQGFSKGLGG